MASIIEKKTSKFKDSSPKTTYYTKLTFSRFSGNITDQAQFSFGSPVMPTLLPGSIIEIQSQVPPVVQTYRLISELGNPIITENLKNIVTE